MPHLVINYKQAVRLPAWGTELLFVDFSEQIALVEFGSALQIPAKFGPGQGEKLELDPRCRVEAADQPREAAPTPFERLEAGVVKDGIQLEADQPVNRGDVPIERAAQRARVGRQAGAPLPPEPGGKCVTLVREESREALRRLSAGSAEEAAREDRLAKRRLENRPGYGGRGHIIASHGPILR
jgi:hypothetical protein